MIENLIKDIDKHLAELFISIEENKEYKFFHFGVAMTAIQKELHNADSYAVKRFTDYIYYLNKIFVEPYSTMTLNTVFNDETKEVTQTTQSSINGQSPTQTSETYTYAKYAVMMLDKYGENFTEVNIDKCIETLKSQSTTEQNTYPISYYSTLLKDLATYENEFDDISNAKIIAQLYSKYFEFATPRPAVPEQSLNTLKEELLYLHDINTPSASNPISMVQELPKQHIEIDKQRLLDCFNATFKGAGRSIDHSDNIFSDLNKRRSDKEMAQIALLIYDSEKVLKSARGRTFANWYKQFCDIVGCPHHKDYKPSNFKNEQLESLRKIFYYL
ncbi:MAG: hypothetical protein SNJ29_08950 [Rikenellaceae bacterium]